jgi:hypothetical protein
MPRYSARIERARDAEESLLRSERELKDDIRLLLRSIGHLDHVLTASRKAHQK